MKIVFNPEDCTYTNVDYKPRDKKRDSEKKVVAGGGAIAATARAKASKSGFDMFTSAGKVSRGMHTVTTTTKVAGNVAKQSRSLFAKVAESARWAKNAVLNWGNSLQKVKFLKPLFASRLFKFGAGCLGYGFGAVTLISGLADIGKATSDTLEKNLSKDA